MSIIIDFNGYHTADNNFFIKEVSLYIIDKKAKVQSNFFAIVKPLTEFHTLSKTTQNNYHVFKNHHGINYKTGKVSMTFLRNKLRSLVDGPVVFVRDHKQKKLLISYTKKKRAKFVCLDDLGYIAVPPSLTFCSNHRRVPGIDFSCANENVVSMTDYVIRYRFNLEIRRNRLHAIIDFSAYRLEENLAIKEIAITFLNHRLEENAKARMIVEPPESFELLDVIRNDTLRLNYTEFYKIYGIKWNSGSLKFEHQRSYLVDQLKNSRFIYVRNGLQKSLLIRSSNQLFTERIVSLDEFRFDSPLNTTTLCRMHANPERNNCVADNVKKMVEWLSQKNLFNAKVRSQFNGNPVDDLDGIDVDDLVKVDAEMADNYADDIMEQYIINDVLELESAGADEDIAGTLEKFINENLDDFVEKFKE